jgi:hypothetical protein
MVVAGLLVQEHRVKALMVERAIVQQVVVQAAVVVVAQVRWASLTLMQMVAMV